MARKEKSWQQAYRNDRVEKLSQSGQSVEAFCRRRKVSPASLYRWRKQLKAKTDVSGLGPSDRFVEVRVRPEVPSPWAWELELRNGRKLRFLGGAWVEELASLAAALEGGAC